MKKFSILAIILLFTSTMLLTACDFTEYEAPKEKGNMVFSLPYMELGDEMRVLRYDSFSEFNRGELAEILDPYKGFPLNKTYFSKEYFKTKNLIVVLFNAAAASDFFIKNLIIDGNNYEIELIRFISHDQEIKTYGCFIVREEKVKDAKVNLEITESYNLSRKMIYHNSDQQEEYTIEKISSLNQLTEYKATKNLTVIMEIIFNLYDELYFTDKELICIEVINKHNTVYIINENNNMLDIYAFDTNNDVNYEWCEIIIYEREKESLSLTQYTYTTYKKADGISSVPFSKISGNLDD